MGYTTSAILTKYFTVYNYNNHYTRFLDHVSKDGAFYKDKTTQISLYLKDKGMDGSKLGLVAQKMFKEQLDKQILLRSIMDYYTLMIYLSAVMLFLLVCYYIKDKKVDVHFRPLLPI